MYPTIKMIPDYSVRHNLIDVEAMEVTDERPTSPVVRIADGVWSKIAGYIKENCDDNGRFEEKNIEVNHDGQTVFFDVTCQLRFRDGECCEALIYWAQADTLDDEFNLVMNDFTIRDLKEALIDAN